MTPATVAAYGVLGMLLCWSRLAGLDHSFWYDEILTVTNYVQGGPHQILMGPYIPNNHELFSIMGWATTSLFGESEVALRLWSAIPFIVGVIMVTTWLHSRVNALTAGLFLFFTTMSPMLFDLSREARGYGLAFLAMSIVVVAGFEAQRTARTSALVAFFAGGLIGTWTLPVFGLAFLATAAVLISQSALRRRGVLGLAVSTLAICAWYAPHFNDILVHSGQKYGAPIPWLSLPIAPIDEVVVPGILWFDDTLLTSYPARLLVVGALGILLLSSPLLRRTWPALLLASGVVVTMIVLWSTQLYLQPRFISYLLVPLFILLASGTAHTIRSAGSKAGVRSLVALGVMIFALAAFLGAAAHLMRFPGEAWKDAADAIDRSAHSGSPVLAYVSKPLGLIYYLDAPIRSLAMPDVASSVCDSEETVVYVTQPYEIQPVDVPCLKREGVQHFGFRQYSRGGEINVWVVPPRA